MPPKIPGLTEAESAYFETGGAVDPTTGKAVEESNAEAEQAETTAPSKPGGDEQQAEAAGGEAEESQAEEGSEETDGDEEVVDVANAEGETRRKMIAFGAYEKQRKAAKAEREARAKLEQQVAYLTGLAQQGRQSPQEPVQPGQAQQPQALGPMPDKAKEPEKYLAWLEAGVQAFHQTQQQAKTMSAEQQQIAALNQAAYQAEQEFIGAEGDPAGHPDYYDALKFLDKSRRDELKMLGYEPQIAQQIIDAQNKDIAVRALNGQGNPAERFYALAKARGFKAPKPAPAVTEKTPAEKVAEQAAKQKTNKSLTGLAGKGASDPLSIEVLANTPTHELAKMLKEGKLDMWSMGQ